MQLSPTGWELPYEITLTWKKIVVVVVLVFYVSPTAKVRHKFGFKLHPKDCRSKGLVCCLCFCLTSLSTIFQSFWDRATASWVFTSTLGTLKCLAQGHYTGVGTLDLLLQSPKL